MSKQRQQDREFWVLRLPDSNVGTQLIYDEEPVVDPAELIKQAADAILQKEKDKVRETDENEG